MLCAYCSTKFEARRNRRLFCTDRCRAAHNREHYLTCFFCGDLGMSREHITPSSTRHGKRQFQDQETVNACLECNSTLQDSFPDNLIERMNLLQERLRKKYDLDKPFPEWSDEEIGELKGTLKKTIRAAVAKRDRAVCRVLHIRAKMRDVKTWIEETPDSIVPPVDEDLSSKNHNPSGQLERHYPEQ